MDDDEVFALGAAAVASAAALFFWYRALMGFQPRVHLRRRVVLAALPWFCLAGLLLVLLFWSAADVRGDFNYILLFLLAGCATTGVAHVTLWLFGYGIRDQAMERHNVGAATIAGAAVVGVFCCFAGSNIGEGPTIWTTLVPAAGAIAAWLLLWLVTDAAMGIAQDVTVERDPASALRLSAMLIANGLILGRAMAGDYVSDAATIRDFIRQGWPALFIACVTAVMQLAWAPTIHEPQRASKAFGALPGVLILALAGAWLIHLGKW